MQSAAVQAARARLWMCRAHTSRAAEGCVDARPGLLHGEELLDRVDDLCRTESRPAFMHARLLQFDEDHVGWRGGATGSMRFGRNLTESEILDQALHFRRREPVNHAVYMGMGEPFLNFDAVVASARRLPDLGITHRRTIIATVGWMPGLRRFADEVEEPIRLALSLHAADPAKRSQLMPVNDRYPLADVLAECRRYFELRRLKVFVEYVLLAGVNDSRDDARLLARLLGRETYKVNLIPYNPTGRYDASERPVIAAFKAELDRGRVPATVRLTRGRDIEAACGQLAVSRGKMDSRRT
jgi:23S rRNA (adenine2503-C2)-methyltransferase